MTSLLMLWLRAAGLVGQTLALGGAVFAVVVLRPGPHQPPGRSLGPTLALTAGGAALAALAQAGLLASLASILGDGGLSPTTVTLPGSSVGIAGMIRIAAALAVLVAALTLHWMPSSAFRAPLLLGLAFLLCVTGTFSSHAMGRIDGRVWLLTITALHQAAAATWVGGLLCAAVLAWRADAQTPIGWLKPFSAVAAVAVGVLALTGLLLSFTYIGTPRLAVGTPYGAMVLTKGVLFVALLVMGALNHRALHGRGLFRRSRRAPGPAPASATDALRMSRRIEVEAGVAVVAALLAASIASAPPSVYVDASATPDEILALFTPKWPRLSSPSLGELTASSDLADPAAPRTAEITAWSEFGHNVAGLFVLAMGVLAMLERTGRAPWARHWPLLIVALAGFVAYSVDPEGWQTGAVGFWEHLKSPEVLQHRILLGLTATLGLAEWRVRSGGHPASPWRWVFPVVTIVSGILLLTHVHEVSDSQSAFFMELSHLPLGLLSLLAGWSRWLELRLPPAGRGGPGRLWGPALAVFGLLLIFYRET